MGTEFDALKERKADDAILRELLDWANSVGTTTPAAAAARAWSTLGSKS
jgi:hypothetical protein